MRIKSLAELEARLQEFPADEVSAARIDAAVELSWEMGLTDVRRAVALAAAALTDAAKISHSRGRAGALRNLGYQKMFAGDPEGASAALTEARAIFEALADRRGLMTTSDLLANLHLRLGAVDSSLVHAHRTLELSEVLGDTRGLGWSHHNLANIHTRLGEVDEAERHLHAAAACFEAIGSVGGAARIHGLLGELWAGRGEQSAAEQSRRRALELWTALGHPMGIGHVSLALVRSCLLRGATEEARAYVAAAERVAGDLTEPEFHGELGLARAEVEVAAGATGAAEAMLSGLLPELAALRDARLELRALEVLADLVERRGDSAGALALVRRRLARVQRSDDSEVRARARNLQVSMAIAAAEREAQVVEGLLLRTLPRPIVQELRANGRVASMLHAQATVLFTDFVGFTRIAERMEPSALVAELDGLFGAFDEVARRHGLEKLKTIGDAYMAAAGVPIPRATHAIDAVLAALEFREILRAREREAAGGAVWKIRIGLSSGPLVAGVIGRDKFAYDVWGDTVNTASRMESSSEPDRVNISGTTFALVAPYFECVPRGLVSAKSKGEIAMYFVERLAPQYAADAAGSRASASLLELLARMRGEAEDRSGE